MATGDVTISGAFNTDATSRTSIDNLITNANIISGGFALVLPDANNANFWVATVEGQR